MNFIFGWNDNLTIVFEAKLTCSVSPILLSLSARLGVLRYDFTILFNLFSDGVFKSKLENNFHIFIGQFSPSCFT